MTTCLPCAPEGADAVAVVLRDDTWSCEVTDGENYPHFHFLVAARGADLPPERRDAGILTLLAEHRDRDAALAVAAGVRAALIP